MSKCLAFLASAVHITIVIERSSWRKSHRQAVESLFESPENANSMQISCGWGACDSRIRIRAPPRKWWIGRSGALRISYAVSAPERAAPGSTAGSLSAAAGICVGPWSGRSRTHAERPSQCSYDCKINRQFALFGWSQDAVVPPCTAQPRRALPKWMPRGTDRDAILEGVPTF